jgi:hypothetical protein
MFVVDNDALGRAAVKSTSICALVAEKVRSLVVTGTMTT